LFISQYATHSVVHCHLAFYIASDIIFEFCGSKYENYLVSKFRLSSAHKKTPTTKIVQRDKMPEWFSMYSTNWSLPKRTCTYLEKLFCTNLSYLQFPQSLKHLKLPMS
jgi:hypothetical protein